MATTPPVHTKATSAQRERRPLKQERALRTRSLIINAAAEVFAERGFALVTLQDVADRAQMTKGAAYFHFGSKEALAIEIVECYLARWQPILDQARALGLSPLDTLVEVLDRTAEAFRTEVMVQAAARLQIERSLIHADLPKPYVAWQAILAELMTQAQAAGQLRADTDPEAAARVLVSSFFGMQHVSDVLTSRADQAQRYTEMRDTFLRGIRP